MSRPMEPRNQTKAWMRSETRDGVAVVVKDYSTRPLWVRVLIGRPTLRREARAYVALEGVRGVPRCFGFEGKDKLILEELEGVLINRRTIGRIPAEFFDAAAEVLKDIHARGVAMVDLHRSNLIVGKNGPFFVDFAHSRVKRRPGPLQRLLFQLDDIGLARIRAFALQLPEPQPEGWFGAVYRGVKRLRVMVLGKRHDPRTPLEGHSPLPSNRFHQ